MGPCVLRAAKRKNPAVFDFMWTRAFSRAAPRGQPRQWKRFDEFALVGFVPRGQLQRNATQRNATQRDATRRNASQRYRSQRNATQRNATQRNATQRNATQRNATQRVRKRVDGKAAFSVAVRSCRVEPQLVYKQPANLASRH